MVWVKFVSLVSCLVGLFKCVLMIFIIVDLEMVFVVLVLIVCLIWVGFEILKFSSVGGVLNCCRCLSRVCIGMLVLVLVLVILVCESK